MGEWWVSRACARAAMLTIRDGTLGKKKSYVLIPLYRPLLTFRFMQRLGGLLFISVLCLFSHLLSPHLIGLPLLLTSSLDIFLLLLLWEN